MRTFTAPVHQEREFQAIQRQKIVPHMTVSVREVLALLSAASAAIAMVLLSVWASGLEETVILSAGTWGVSFIFMGLAVDNRESKALFLLFSGFALMALAWLQNTVSPDFVILSGVLLASWVSFGLYRLLR